MLTASNEADKRTGLGSERTVILGSTYPGRGKGTEARRHIESLFRFTYRRDFPELSPYRISSDSGWGCMLRAAQMLMACALQRHLLGREWRRGSDPATLRENENYCNILRWFSDYPGAPHQYSIHHMVQCGISYDKLPGEWFGPSTAALVLRDLARLHRIKYGGSMDVLVTQGDTIYVTDAENICAAPIQVSSRRSAQQERMGAGIDGDSDGDDDILADTAPLPGRARERISEIDMDVGAGDVDNGHDGADDGADEIGGDGRGGDYGSGNDVAGDEFGNEEETEKNSDADDDEGRRLRATITAPSSSSSSSPNAEASVQLSSSSIFFINANGDDGDDHGDANCVGEEGVAASICTSESVLTSPNGHDSTSSGRCISYDINPAGLAEEAPLLQHGDDGIKLEDDDTHSSDGYQSCEEDHPHLLTCSEIRADGREYVTVSQHKKQEDSRPNAATATNSTNSSAGRAAAGIRGMKPVARQKLVAGSPGSSPVDPLSSGLLRGNHIDGYTGGVVFDFFDPLLNPPPVQERPWRCGLMVCVPLRLGIEAVSPHYIEELKEVLSSQYCLGFIGGRPNHAIYFVGYRATGTTASTSTGTGPSSSSTTSAASSSGPSSRPVGCEFLGLDPHTTYPAASMRPPFPSTELMSQVHVTELDSLEAFRLDPSLALAFYFRGKEEFDLFCEETRINVEKKKMRGITPLFYVQHAAPKEYDGSDDLGVSSSWATGDDDDDEEGEEGSCVLDRTNSSKQAANIGAEAAVTGVSSHSSPLAGTTATNNNTNNKSRRREARTTSTATSLPHTGKDINDNEDEYVLL